MLALLFWAVVFVFFLVEICFVEVDNGFGALVVLAIAITTFNYWLHWHVWTWFTTNLGHSLEYATMYIGVGLLWSFARWYIYLVQFRNSELRSIENDRARRTKSPSTDWGPCPSLVVPIASQHRLDITRWMAWWPFSIVGTLFNKLIRKLWTQLYEIFGRVYQRMADHVFKQEITI